MDTRKTLFYLLAVLLGGCVPVFSLNPLYTEKDVVFKKELLGIWADPNEDGNTWKFERDVQSKNAYRLSLNMGNGDGAKGLFNAHLVKLKDQLYLDVYPAPQGLEDTMNGLGEVAKDPNSNVWPLNFAFLVPVHTFIKIDSIESSLTMYLTDDQLMKELLQRDPNAVRHALLKGNRYVLTASTKELQAFVTKYADGNRLFEDEDPIVLKRAKAKKTKRPSDKKPGDSPGK